MSWPTGTSTPTLVAHREENPHDPGTTATALGPQRPARIPGRLRAAAPTPAPAAGGTPAAGSTAGRVPAGDRGGRAAGRLRHRSSPASRWRLRAADGLRRGAAPVVGNYADWPKRALGALIDYIIPSLLAGLIGRGNTALGNLLSLVAFAWALYNCYLGGQTGQSYGKRIAGTRLISETTGTTIGGGMGIGRYFVHILDSLACFVGWFWPLWDSKRQTFADKILKTVVVTTDAPR